MTTPHLDARAPRSRTWFWVFLIALGALMLRSLEIGSEPFGHAEIAQRQRLEGNLSEVAHAVVARGEPVGYAMALSLWMRLFGADEFWLRLPSLVAGVACVIVIAKLGRRAFTEPVALMAAALLAVHPIAVTTSQDLGRAALGTLALLISFVFFQRVLEGERGRTSAGYVVFTALLPYVHDLAALALLAQAFLCALELRRASAEHRSATVQTLRLQSLAALLMLPGVALTLTAAGGAAPANPFGPWIVPPTAADRALALVGDLVGGPVSAYALPRPHLAWTRPAVWILGGTFLLLGLLSRGGEARDRRSVQRHAFLLLVVLPALLVLQRPDGLVLCIPSAMLLVARGIATVGPARSVRHLAVVLVTILLAAHLVRWPEWREPDWPSVQRTLSERAKPGDWLIVGGVPDGPQETTAIDFQRRLAQRLGKSMAQRTVALPFHAFHRAMRGELDPHHQAIVEAGRERLNEVLRDVEATPERRVWIALERSPYDEVADDHVFLETPEYRALTAACGKPSTSHKPQRIELLRLDRSSRNE